jgi:hypothetical protein
MARGGVHLRSAREWSIRVASLTTWAMDQRIQAGLPEKWHETRCSYANICANFRNNNSKYKYKFCYDKNVPAIQLIINGFKYS